MNLFTVKCPLVAMIHLEALPGTPRHQYSPQQIVDRAVAEAEVYRQAGADGLAIENMHDVPYLNRTAGPEITAMMAVVGREVKRTSGLPCGIQVLAGANRQALAVALAAGLDFVRAEGFVFSHVADEGLMHADSGELLRYRKQIGAEHIPILTDIKKKHSSHAITGDVSLAETAKAAAFFLSDGVIVTGTSTGEAANLAEIRAVKTAVEIPVWVGSGVTLDNLADYAGICDGMIVGSYFKEKGFWAGKIDPEKVKRFVEKLTMLRNR
ncbi:MAG: BtpA/SgcQ family protein [Bacteroidia bacterium]|nr:BtpA/SgcQ family protein [Bacteroidia bacterium]